MGTKWFCNYILSTSALFISAFLFVESVANAQAINTYKYDSHGRVIETGSNYGSRILYSYDEVGNVIARSKLNSYCPNNTGVYSALLPGTKFQWQVKIDSNSAFTSISDNNFYYGTRIDSLIIMNPSTSMVGYKYRCAVTLDGETSYSPEYELRIKAIWKGGTNSDWQNPANWECGLVPAEKIDVIIPKGTNSPVLAQDAKVESVLLKEGEVLRVAPGVKLEITGKPKQ